MKKIKRALAALLALLLALGTADALAETAPAATALTLDDLDRLNGGAARVTTRDGRVTFVDGACTDGPVNDVEAAARVVDAMIPLMGGDERTGFEPWRTLTDTSGNRYYVFQQMYDEIQGNILIISHQERILDIADKIILLSNGEVETIGDKETVMPRILGESGFCPQLKE